MKKTLLFLVFPLLCLGAFAQDFQFAKSFGAPGGNDYGKSIVLDASGNTFTIGYFSGTVDFDAGAGITELTSAGLSDIFILKLNASGDFVWAKNIGGIGGKIRACLLRWMPPELYMPPAHLAARQISILVWGQTILFPQEAQIYLF